MSSNSSGKKLERFFTGKGFYIVLFLCAAVIGVSAYMMAAGNETMAKDVVTNDDTSVYSSKRVETVIIPPTSAVDTDTADAGSAVPAMKDDAAPTDDTAAQTPESVDTFAKGEAEAEAEAPVAWLWPVSGSVERGHSETKLTYDVTLRDWRTHSGIDIDAPMGSTVTATRGGIVESVMTDDLYGTVITINHGDGTKAVYANLAPELAVAVNDTVESGYVIGAVGASALAEVGQESHLHFAVTVNGQNVDPLALLSA